MAKIIDVAKRINVSPATVSRVLNNSTSVKPETREKVLRAIEEMNYSPNHSSQSLRRQQSQTLLVLIPDFANPFYGDILDGMDEAARIRGYRLLQVSTYSEPRREREAVRLLETKQADGAIFLAPSLSLEELHSLNERYSIVQCCEYLPNDDQIPRVSIDNYAAAYEAASHLIQVGHRRIAMFSSTNAFISTSKREQAYRDALADKGIPFEERLLIRGSYSFDSGIASAQRILEMPDRPTAILTISDAVAAGAVRRIFDEGLSVPGDIAVMGFDNIDLARMITPPLSTIAQPLRQLGKTSVQMLIDRIEGHLVNKELYLPFELVLRKSTL